MKLEYLKKMDRITRGAGSRRPDDVLAYMGFIYMDPGESLPGFITRRKSTVYYGVNKNLSKQQYAFGSFHEAFHGICTYLDIPGFLRDGANADSFQDRHMVAWTERDANIGAADVMIETDAFLEMVGHDSADVQACIKSVESFERAVEDYRRHYEIVVANGSPENRIRRMAAYQKELARMYTELQEQAQDISNSGCCLSTPEIAREFGVPEFIVDYKYEAMTVRIYNVPSVELPTFDRVFGGW